MAGMTASVSSPVLITGFGPFGPHAVNPSQEVVRALQAAPGDDVVAEVLPVSFTGAPAKLGELVRVHRPRAVLSLGLAGDAQVLRVVQAPAQGKPTTAPGSRQNRSGEDVRQSGGTPEGSTDGHELTIRIASDALREYDKTTREASAR